MKERATPTLAQTIPTYISLSHQFRGFTSKTSPGKILGQLTGTERLICFTNAWLFLPQAKSAKCWAMASKAVADVCKSKSSSFSPNRNRGSQHIDLAVLNVASPFTAEELDHVAPHLERELLEHGGTFRLYCVYGQRPEKVG